MYLQQCQERKKLIEFESGRIDAFSFSRFNSRTIVKNIGRSKTVVNNLLNLNDNYLKTNSGGRPKTLSSREEQTVLRVASREKKIFKHEKY